MRHLLSVPAMRPPGSPRRGVPGRLEYIRAAGERPPRARPQRRGSPGPIPNPAVKPAFAESTAARGCGRAGRRARGGRFSMRVRAPGAARAACAGRGPRGDVAPCGPPCILQRSRRRKRRHAPIWRRASEGRSPLPDGSADGGACATSADRGAGGPPGGASLPGRPSFGRCAPARFCAVCAPCNQSWCFRWLSLRGGLVGGRLSFVMRRFPIRIVVGHRKRLCGL